MDYLSFFQQAKMSLLTVPKPAFTGQLDDADHSARPYIPGNMERRSIRCRPR